MLTTALFMLSLSAPPAADQVKAVFEHYYQGEGIVLADVYLCSEINKKKGEGHNDCKTRAGGSAKKGDKIEVYMTYLLPKGQEKALMVQAVHNGVVRSTRDVNAKSYSMRSRTWKTFTLSKKGKWEFKVLDEGGKALKTLSIEAS